MLHAFQNHLEQHFSFLYKVNIGLAISGGVDSVVLCHLCKQIGLPITLLHCNFQLRHTDSDTDQAFVRNLAAEYDFPFYTVNFETKLYKKSNKLTTQVAARELRYQWFKKMAKKCQLDYILTAHHLNDSIETFFINLTRGTGLEGLTGVPQRQHIYIRPLLPFSKTQILEYANSNNLKWREDASNHKTDYLRNKIRHHIIPELEGISSNLMSSFSATLHHLQQNKQLVDTYVTERKSLIMFFDTILNIHKLSIEAIKKEKNYKLVLFQLLKPYNFSAWEDVYNLCDSISGKKVHSPTHILLKNRDYLLLYPVEKDNNDAEITILQSDKKVKLSDSEELKIDFMDDNGVSDLVSKENLLLDLDKIKFPLTVRRWKEGDYFYPTGMQGKKKLSKYFKDEKMSLLEKEQSWVLCSENNILCVLNRRADRRFVADKSSKGLFITYRNLKKD